MVKGGGYKRGGHPSHSLSLLSSSIVCLHLSLENDSSIHKNGRAKTGDMNKAKLEKSFD